MDMNHKEVLKIKCRCTRKQFDRIIDDLKVLEVKNQIVLVDPFLD
ncbi:hypothetical protein RV18_GL003081 [Enterococcus termitis]|nr:hypothetical protein RV18_GL003081 [Enterococcus termitis]